MADAARRYADSITFTVDQLDDLITCVEYTMRCAPVIAPTPADEERVRAERRQLRDMLQRFARAAKRRGRRRL